MFFKIRPSGIPCACGKNPAVLKNHSVFGWRYPLRVWEKPFQGCGLFPVAKVPVSATVALHSKVLHSLHGRMSSGPPQPYFVEILRRGGSPAAGGKRKPHLRVWRRWGWVWLDHQGVERSVSIVCGISCVWEKRRESQSRNVRVGGISCVWEESSQGCGSFSFTRVPVSTTVAL